jgi:hypothetical protein
MTGGCRFRVTLVTGDNFEGLLVGEDAEKIILRLEERGRPLRTLRLYLRFVAAVEELGCARARSPVEESPSGQECH